MFNDRFRGEAFLWSGTGISEIDDTIMDLVQLSEINLEASLEIADEIASVLSGFKENNCGDTNE